MFRKKRIKKLYGVTHFYTDDSKRFEFYYRRNWMDQFEVTVWDVENNTNRWFAVTSPVFYSFLALTETNSLLAFSENVQKAPKPKVVNELLHNSKFKLLAHKVGKFNAESVVGKLGEFGPEDNRKGVLLLKRVASVPEMDNMVLGMDTLEIPIDGIVKFVKDVRKKYFKDVDIKIEAEEEIDGTN